MYCPRCLTEYRPGFIECADCRAPLVGALPAQPPAPIEPDYRTDERDPDLALVLEVEDSFALDLAKAALDDAGITYLGQGNLPTQDDPHHGFPASGHSGFYMCSRQVFVAKEDEAEARGLLAPLANPEPLDEADPLP